MRNYSRMFHRAALFAALFVAGTPRSAYAWEELPEQGTMASALRLVLLGRFGGFALGLIGLFGLYCLIFGNTKSGDEKSEGTLLTGMFCMVLVIALSWYRFSAWKNSIGMASEH